MRFCLVLLAFATAAAWNGAAFAEPAQGLDLEGQGVNLALRLSAGPAGGQAARSPEVSSQADLTGQLPGLQTQVQLGMKTGQAPASGSGLAADSGWWNSTSAGLNAAWTPFDRARLEVGAVNATRFEFTAADPVFSDASQHYAESRQSGVKALATLAPPLPPGPFGALAVLAPTDVTLGARLSSDVERSAWISGSGAQGGDLLQSDTRQLSAGLTFKPLRLVTLEAGGQMQSMDLAWSGGRAVTHAALEPSARLSATPWAGGSLRLSLEGALSPLTTDQFVGYGQGAAALEAVQPNREWRYGATLTQKARLLDLTASVLQARVRSVAYLASSGLEGSVREEDTRMEMGAGDRREMSAGLAAPVSAPGLAPLRLEAQATWRASAVRDPLTGTLGRMSGERPYDASLSLSQALGARMRWGVKAQAAGTQTNLGPTQIASLSATAGLGGFWQYSGRLGALRLSLDNLLGGERAERDVYYAGGRDLNLVDHVGETRTVDRAVRIALIRPL